MQYDDNDTYVLNIQWFKDYINKYIYSIMEYTPMSNIIFLCYPRNYFKRK